MRNVAAILACGLFVTAAILEQNFDKWCNSFCRNCGPLHYIGRWHYIRIHFVDLLFVFCPSLIALKITCSFIYFLARVTGLAMNCFILFFCQFNECVTAQN
jgi:hypothetical protein